MIQSIIINNRLFDYVGRWFLLSMKKVWRSLIVSAIIISVFIPNGYAKSPGPRPAQAILPHQSSSGTNPAPKVSTDTLAWLAAEDGGGSSSWNDRISGDPWTMLNLHSPPEQDEYWHVDDLLACSGDSAWLCADTAIAGKYGCGYDDNWLQFLDTPAFSLGSEDTSTFLIYRADLMCEENNTFPWTYSWDGYQVRISVNGGAYQEIEPYQVSDDNSYYRGGRFYGEYDSLFALGMFGYTGGGFSTDRPDLMSCDQPLIFDLRNHAGDLLSIRFIFASDASYSTAEIDSLFGLYLDDILVVDGMDSLTLATLPDPLGGDTLFFEDCEGPANQMSAGTPSPEDTWWWLESGGYGGSSYKASDSDPATGEYLANMAEMLISPWIRKDDLGGDVTELWLDYHLRGNFNDPDLGDDHVKNLYRTDAQDWIGISTLTQPTDYFFADFDDNGWWDMSQWSDIIRDLSPLLDSTNWDSLQVAIYVYTDGDEPQPGNAGFQVDDVVVTGQLGNYYNIGITAARIPSPNSNDVQVHLDTVAVTNWQSNTVGPGDYHVRMTILDSTGAAVFGPGAVISLAPTPQIGSLATVKVPLDPSAGGWTPAEEGMYTFKIWTECTGNHEDIYQDNDTLWNDVGAFPQAYCYPAGTGELRYHDQDFYSHAEDDAVSLGFSDIAAVRFILDPEMYPFDLEWIDIMMLEYGHDFDLLIYGPGSQTQPGTLLATVPFSVPNTFGDKELQRINVSAVSALKGLNSEFWVGVEADFTTSPFQVIYYEGSDSDILGEWDHSYFYDGATWEKREQDWLITAGIRFRTIFPEGYAAGADLHLEWDDVSQAAKYYVYREADPEVGDPTLFDSTAVSQYTDPGVLGGPGSGYYYWFHTVHQDGVVYDKLSEPIGDFGRELTNE